MQSYPAAGMHACVNGSRPEASIWEYVQEHIMDAVQLRFKAVIKRFPVRGNLLFSKVPLSVPYKILRRYTISP